MRRLILLVVLVTIGCSNDSKSGETSAAKAGIEDTKTASMMVHVVPVRSPYVNIPENKLIDGRYVMSVNPIGYGVQFDYGNAPNYSEPDCVDLEVKLNKYFTTSSRFGQVDKSEVREFIDPFMSWRERAKGAESLNPEIEDAITRVSEKLGEGSVADGFGFVSEFAGLSGQLKATDSPQSCKSGNAKLNRYLRTIGLGIGATVILKVNFPNAKSVEAWTKAFKEHPLYSIFDQSDINSAKVSARLKKMNATFEVYVLQLAGNIEETKMTIAKNGCAINAITKCRNLKREIADSIQAQSPNTITMDNWQSFSVIAFDTQEF